MWVKPPSEDPTYDTMFTIQREFLAVSANTKSHRGKSYAATKIRMRCLRLKRRKRGRGANPRPMVLKVSALPLHHAYLSFLVSSPPCIIYNLKRFAYMSTCKKYTLAGLEPPISGFKFQCLTPMPLRPAVSCLFSAIYDLLLESRPWGLIIQLC